ncbi:MAG: fumarylacetoacetate hydrolase family protein [Bacteroidetes bacterium]|nr:fumarylacetoacetate hydrolase family protein [Bacteroidota bacterium]
MKVFCIGRNYVEHARELGNEVPESPVIFTKPPTALVKDNKPVYYPEFTNDLHYEGELVIRISGTAKRVKEKFAHKYYDAVSVGFDLTARDIQSELKAGGLPWDIAKGFDGAGPVGRFVPKEQVLDNGNYSYTIYKNNEMVQSGDTSLMIFTINNLIQQVSRYFTLQKGDLIFTGTPKGVGPLSIGDELSGSIGEEELIRFRIK